MNLYSYSTYQRPGVGNQFYWVEIKVLVGLGPPGGSRGESTSLPFWFPVAALLLSLYVLAAHVPRSSLRAFHGSLSPCSSPISHSSVRP